MPAIIAAGIGAAVSLKGQSDAKKAANAANTAAQNAQVNIPAVSQQATDQALRNLALSRQVEAQYTPENALLRQGSILGLMAQLGQNPNQEIYDRLSQQFNGNPIPAQTANSDLLRQAVAQASSDLSQGSALPLDVRNLVARTAAGKSGSVTGGLGLGRDIQARDLGLTSLDIMQRRLANAQALGQADLGANQFNASMAQRANEFGATNNLNLAQMLAQLNGIDFSKYLAAAQFGQTLQSPTVGLDPSAIANLAVGNSNAASQAGINAAGVKAQSANNLTNFGGQLFGYGLANMSNGFGGSGGFFPPPYQNSTLATSNGQNSNTIASYYGFPK